MDHAATMQRAYDLINTGDIDGFGDLVADDFVEHEQIPGLEPSKDGVLTLFRGWREAFPDLHAQNTQILAENGTLRILTCVPDAACSAGSSSMCRSQACRRKRSCVALQTALR